MRDVTPVVSLMKDVVVVNMMQVFMFWQKKKLRSRQKKLKVYDLSTLSESLPELKGPKQPPAAPKFKLNCKSRTELV